MSTQKNGLPEFVPVVVVGAGPAGIAAATLLGQYGVETLVLDRHETVYPLPRAVHADDEVYRILARLGIGDEFAAHSRPAHGLRLIDPQMRVLSEIPRSTEPSAAHGFPQMNMFDQPELEAMLRANVKRYPEGHRPRQRGGHLGHPEPARPGAGELPGPGARRRAERAGQLCAGLRRREQPYPRGHRGAHVRAAVHPGLAGHRRQHRRRSRPVGGLPPAVQPRAWRHLHAGVRNPLPLGIPAGRRRNRSRLPDPGRRRAADQALAGRHSRSTRWSWCG